MKNEKKMKHGDTFNSREKTQNLRKLRSVKKLFLIFFIWNESVTHERANGT